MDIQDPEGEPLWVASDGTVWFWSAGSFQCWTGWQPGEDGVWVMERVEFRRIYPEAPVWDHEGQ